MFTSRHMQRGFALILVLGILAVAALIIGTIITRQENEAVWSPVTNTKEQLDEVQRALAAYERTEHRLPMPAARTTNGGQALHVEALSLLDGAEDDEDGYRLPASIVNQLVAGNHSVMLAGDVVVASSDPTNLQKIMLVGAVPTETLGLPREAAEDKNGHLLTYAVTIEMVNRFKYSQSEGVIELKDLNNQPVANKLAYIVLSHGKNAKGAWSAKSRFKGRDCSGVMNNDGTPAVPGAGSAPEIADYGNCAYNGATFVISDLTMVRGEGYFDDQLLHGKKDRVAVSQNRSCIGPIDVNWGDPLCPSCNCQGQIPAPGLVSVGTHGSPKTFEVEDTAPADIGTATFECNDGTASLVAGSNNCTRPCILPWGGTLDNGDSVQAYSTNMVGCNEACPAPSNRMCVNGTLTGSGDYPSCAVATNCASSNGTCAGPFPTGNGPSNPIYGFCETGTKQNDNGLTNCGDTRTWTCAGSDGGSSVSCYFDYDACGQQNCTLPWGGTLANGDSVPAYAASSVPCGEACPAATMRACSNGVLSGAGDYASCSVAECGSCTLPWGGTLANGASVQAYSANTMACGETCPEPTTRTCNNGVLSGAGDHASCTVEPCGTCNLPWGGSINHGESVRAYQTATVNTCFGGCYSEMRACTNGTLSGSYVFGDCRSLSCVDSCGECVRNGGTWTDHLCPKFNHICVDGNNRQTGSATPGGDICIDQQCR